MIFGDRPIQPGELVTTLQRRANQLARKRDLRERNTAWTYAIKNVLAKMATERGFEPFSTDTAKKKSEFMLDQVWWKEDKTGSAAVLGIESEWGNPRNRDCASRAGCVADDFEKLLQFKAPLKLLLFTSDNQEMRNATHKILHRCLRRFRQHVAGETYVFAEFSARECFSYICEIKHHGRDASLTLEPLDAKSEQILAAA